MWYDDQTVGSGILEQIVPSAIPAYLRQWLQNMVVFIAARKELPTVTASDSRITILDKTDTNGCIESRTQGCIKGKRTHYHVSVHKAFNEIPNSEEAIFPTQTFH